MNPRLTIAALTAALLPLNACTMVDIAVWSDEGGLVELSGDAAVDDAGNALDCDLWQSNGAMQTDCPQDASGIATFSGSDADNLYRLTAVPDPGFAFAGWNGCDLTGTDGFITWRFYTSDDGTTCNVDHGGTYDSYTITLAESEPLADIVAKFRPAGQ